jgi:hypothetical protein
MRCAVRCSLIANTIWSSNIFEEKSLNAKSAEVTQRKTAKLNGFLSAFLCVPSRS